MGAGIDSSLVGPEAYKNEAGLSLKDRIHIMTINDKVASWPWTGAWK